MRGEHKKLLFPYGMQEIVFLTKRELSIWENGIVLENRKAYDKNIRHV